jgi:A/G-specific adenine glycosylase
MRLLLFDNRNDDKEMITENWTPLLMEWYDKNKRELPWRTGSPRDPYKVWVSEIMLQQTRVEAVKAYYTNWMEHFPDIPALAAAEEEDVVRQWQGLGYYSRARNLHTAVREVMETYGGHVPETREEISRLKGIGDYTAGAILSLAYGKQETAVDGNVLRVFARIYNIKENILSAKVKKQITELVKVRQDASRPGDFNEALMDLGATVCIPGQPRCEVCPVSKVCKAKAGGKESEIPVRITRKEVPVEAITVFVVCCETEFVPECSVTGSKLQSLSEPAAGKDKTLKHLSTGPGRKISGTFYLLHRRPAKGLLAGMWEFPNCEGEGKQGKTKLASFLAEQGIVVKEEGQTGKPVMKIRHVFSHKIWQMSVYAAKAEKDPFAGLLAATGSGKVKNGKAQIKGRGTGKAEQETENMQLMPEQNSPDWLWVPVKDLESFTLAGPHNKILHDLLENKI